MTLTEFKEDRKIQITRIIMINSTQYLQKSTLQFNICILILCFGTFRRKRKNQKPTVKKSHVKSKETNAYSQPATQSSHTNNGYINQPEESDHTYYNTINMTTKNNKQEPESKVKINNVKLSELRKKHSDYENFNTTEGSKEITDRVQSLTHHQVPGKPDKDKIEDTHVYEDAEDVNKNKTVSLMPTDCEMVDNELYAATNDLVMENNVNKLIKRDISKEGVNVNPHKLFMEDNCLYESTLDAHGNRTKKEQGRNVTYMVENDLYSTTR